MLVCPRRENAGVGGMRLRVERRLRLESFQHIRDQGGVAIDIAANLQYGRTPVTAGERDHIGLRQHHRYPYRSIAQSLESQNRTDFFRERGFRVVMQDDFGHGTYRASRVRLTR